MEKTQTLEILTDHHVKEVVRGLKIILKKLPVIDRIKLLQILIEEEEKELESDYIFYRNNEEIVKEEINELKQLKNYY